MRRLLVFRSLAHEPFVNSAMEGHIFDNVVGRRGGGPVTHALLLWRNAPSVIIGRNQNPWKECRLDEMDRRGVELVRRQSGGGAVYHDLGNTNFSFMCSKSEYDKDRNCAILLGALRRFGIGAALRGRNDVVVGDTKISGHAYRYNDRAAIHHGTLLRDVDMSVLASVLSPHKSKLQSKGVASVAARVTNLAQSFPALTHEAFCDAMVAEFSATYPGPAVEESSPTLETMLAVPEVAQQREALRSWDWRFGQSPQFSMNVMQRFPWGLCDLYADWEGGLVKRSKLYSDALSPELVTALQAGVDAQLNPDVSKQMVPSTEHTMVDEFFTWVRTELRE